MHEGERTGAGFTVGWILLLVAAGLMTLNHVVLFFALDEPILFLGYALFNIFAMAVLVVPFRRREWWAFCTTWLLPLGLAVPGILDGALAFLYLPVAVISAVALLLTVRGFNGHNRPAVVPSLA